MKGSERYVLPLYLILTPLLGLAIALFLPLPPAAVVFLAALVPALLAILLAALAGDRKGLASLLRKLIQWRVGLKWYAIALLLPLGIHLAIGALALLLRWIPAIQLRPWSTSQLVLGVLILILAIPEELGWRGYALPQLLARRSALFSALLIGLSWGIFHLGLGLMEGRPLLPTFLVPFGFSVILTWLSVHTQGTLVIVILCHFGFNYFVFFEEGMALPQILWLEAVVTLALALILILLFGPNLQRSLMKKQPAVGTGTEKKDRRRTT